MHNLEVRAYTTEELQHLFLVCVWQAIATCEAQPIPERQKLETLAHNILVMLDGGTAVLPLFLVAPNGDLADQASRQRHGEKWFPINDGTNIQGKIAGTLHEEFYDSKPYGLSEESEALADSYPLSASLST